MDEKERREKDRGIVFPDTHFLFPIGEKAVKNRQVKKAEPKMDNQNETSQEVQRKPVEITVYIRGGICIDVVTNLQEASWEYRVVDYDNEPNLPDDYDPFSGV